MWLIHLIVAEHSTLFYRVSPSQLGSLCFGALRTVPAATITIPQGLVSTAHVPIVLGMDLEIKLLGHKVYIHLTQLYTGK